MASKKTHDKFRTRGMEIFSDRQNSGLAKGAEPIFEQVPDKLVPFYTKVKEELTSMAHLDTDVTKDIAGIREGSQVTPMAIMAVMNPKTGKYIIVQHDVIAPSDMAELQEAMEIFKQPKPKRGRKKGSKNRKKAADETENKEGGETPPAEEPPEEPEQTAPPEDEQEEGEETQPLEEEQQGPPEGYNTKNLVVVEGGGEAAGEEEGEGGGEEPSEAQEELEEAAAAREEAEEEQDDEDKDPDLAALFGD